jgi:hypothetical protein
MKICGRCKQQKEDSEISECRVDTICILCYPAFKRERKNEKKRRLKDERKTGNITTYECEICKEIKPRNEFSKCPDQHICKVCYPTHRHNDEYTRIHKMHEDGYYKKYRADNYEEYKEYMKQYNQRPERKKVERERSAMRRRQEGYKEWFNAYMRNYAQTETGRLVVKKAWEKRHRDYGFEPMNPRIENREFHHLHVDIYGNEDHAIGIHVPYEVHKSIGHSGKTMNNMKAVLENIIEWHDAADEAFVEGTYGNTILLMLIYEQTPNIKGLVLEEEED